jgi:hypothetical protein
MYFMALILVFTKLKLDSNKKIVWIYVHDICVRHVASSNIMFVSPKKYLRMF